MATASTYEVVNYFRMVNTSLSSESKAIFYSALKLKRTLFRDNNVSYHLYTYFEIM